MHTVVQSQFFTSLEPLQRGLASSSDKKAWAKACADFHATMRAQELFAYPRRHDEAMKILADIGRPIDAATKDLVVFQQLEAPRRLLREQLIMEARQKFDEAVLPRIRALWPRVLERLEAEIAKLEASERATAQRWQIPYEASTTLNSLRATLHHHQQNPPVQAYCGDDVEAGFRAWFASGESFP